MQLYIKTDQEVGKTIKAQRKSLNITQVDLAGKFEIAQGTLSRIERGILEAYLPADVFCTALNIEAPVIHAGPDPYAEARAVQSRISKIEVERAEDLELRG